MKIKIHPDAIYHIVHGEHGAPFEVLGCHRIDAGRIAVRAFRPKAKKLALVDKSTNKRLVEMERLHEWGFFEATIEGDAQTFQYYFEEEDYDGQIATIIDPYNFPPFLSDYDLYLLGEGRHLYSYEKLGAHLDEINGVAGARFAVWAPNAYRVSVVGDFNDWDARVHPMRFHHANGFWELFIPGLGEGGKYKYDINSHNQGYRSQKSDPYGFFSELRPKTASIIANLDTYTWGDAEWMERRAKGNLLEEPVSIYEVHLGSWKRRADGSWLNYRELAHELVAYVQEMNYTHVELMPVAEHPLDNSWGYQVTGYFAPTSRYGSPADFMYFVDYCHQNGIGVILDWVPAHFPKDGYSLSYFDGTHLYEHEDPRLGEHPDWGTYIFNYGRNEVRNFLISNALFWLRKYHIDGLRVDAVSSMLYLDFSREDGQWLPNKYGGNENLEAIDFLKEVNTLVHSEYPGVVTIAEESTSWAMVSRPTYLGGLGFTFKWNMGWMHDTLEYMKKDPVYRRYHHNQITFSGIYAFTENFILSLSHDEVVHGKGSLIGKMPGDWWQQFASLRLLLGFQTTFPGKFLNFMGSEFGQFREWSEARSLDWHLLEWVTHTGARMWARDLNAFYRQEPALYEVDFAPEGFRWIDPNDADNNVFTYMRFAKDREDFLVIALNFTPASRSNYRIGVPEAGFYREILNSDAEIYGGGNIGNMGGVSTENILSHNVPQSLRLTLPPLAIVILKYIPEEAPLDH